MTNAQKRGGENCKTLNYQNTETINNQYTKTLGMWQTSGRNHIQLLVVISSTNLEHVVKQLTN